MTEREGVRIAGLVWDGVAGGAEPTLLLLHPNGFCAGLFEPLVPLLPAEVRVAAVDLRGHGASGTPSEREGLAFEEMARDVWAFCDVVGASDLRVLGQSLGGAVATLVDRERPGAVERALLAEAVLFPMAESGPSGESRASPMAEAARRRRRVFASREAVVEAYLGRGGLVGIGRESMEAYARWGFVDREDGHVELACDPETEASIFELTPTLAGNAAGWDHLPHMGARTRLVAGRDTNIGVARFEAQAAHAGLELDVVDGGHFVIQEDLVRGAAMVRDHLL